MNFLRRFSRRVSGRRGKLRRIITVTGNVDKLKKLCNLNPKFDITKQRFVSSQDSDYLGT